MTGWDSRVAKLVWDANAALSVAYVDAYNAGAPAEVDEALYEALHATIDAVDLITNGRRCWALRARSDVFLRHPGLPVHEARP